MKTHGCSGTKEYRAWVRMNHRCHNPDYLPEYHRYGARGITVCTRWRESFLNFLADMGKAPTPAHTIERTDNDAGYNRHNCVWATRSQQASNRSTSVRWTFRGLTKTMAQWGEFCGVSRKMLWKRHKLGWKIEDILGDVWPDNIRKAA